MLFRNDINGLRAIAVIAVVIFHFHPNALTGGFAGVDVFFVISGYLMTSIIFNAVEQRNFNLVDFYLARARRIIPALAFLCLVLMIIGWFYSTPSDYRALGKHITSSLAFLSNTVYFTESGYFNAASHEKWLLHTWSLSVEWQFYLLYPLLILLLTQLFTPNNAKKALLMLTLSGFLFSIVATTQWPNSAFYLLPARAWELLVGGIVFLYPLKASDKVRHYLHYIGFALIVISYSLLTDTLTWPGSLSAIPVIGACLLIWSSHYHSFISNSSLLQFIGKTSYSIYLWHWPIVAFLNNIGKLNDLTYQVLGASLAVVLGWFSYTFIESSVKKIRFLHSSFIIVSTTFTIAMLSTSIYLTNGYASYRVNSDFVNRIKEQTMPSRQNGYCFYHFNEGKTIKVGQAGTQCLLGNKNASKKGLLFGDSFAGHYEPLWDETSKKLGIGINAITTNWCFPSLTDFFIGPKNHPSYQQCLLNRQVVKEQLDNYTFIIIASKWDSVMSQGYIDETLTLIEYAITKGLRVYIMPSPTTYDTDILKRFHTALFNNIEFTTTAFSKLNDKFSIKVNKLLEDYANTHSNVTFITRSDLFNDDDLYLIDGVYTPYSLDGMHISLQGSIEASKTLEKSAIYKELVKDFSN